MVTSNIPLSLIEVASPCQAPWGAMSGDDRVRFCGQCSRNVFNLSEMTLAEAQALITETEGRLCVRFYRRIDGTIMTHDCPVGWQAVKRRAARIAGLAATFVVAVFGLVTLGIFSTSTRGNGMAGFRLLNPIESIRELLFPRRVVMGVMCAPPAIQAPPAKIDVPPLPTEPDPVRDAPPGERE